jgi:hypothetical protein
MGFMIRVDEEYNEVISQYSDLIGMYIVRLMKVLSEKSKVTLDGRRIGMIRRNILSIISVNKAKNKKLDLDNISYNTLLNSLPNASTGKEI